MTPKKHNAEEGSTTVPPHMSLHEERKMEKKALCSRRKKERKLSSRRKKERNALPALLPI
jgi:hypothetical protein